jgi:hypothetical protein
MWAAMGWVLSVMNDNRIVSVDAGNPEPRTGRVVIVKESFF